MSDSTIRLLQAFPRQVLFSPEAWAKMQWFFIMAGKLEMSGFGVTKPDSPLFVREFHTIEQLSDGVNTEMDDMAFNRYIGRMAKRKIPPNCCARIWIHSHPFSDSNPSPSHQDNTTFKEKICDNWEADYGVMLIVGKKDIYGELFVHTDKINGYIRTTIGADVDWMGLIWDKHDEKWQKELDANVKEAPKKEIKVVEKEKILTGQNYPSMHQEVEPGLFQWSEEEERQWISEWKSLPWAIHSMRQWIWGRAEGFTVDEMQEWGQLTLYNTPEILRKACFETSKKHSRQIKKIRQRKGGRHGKRKPS